MARRVTLADVKLPLSELSPKRRHGERTKAAIAEQRKFSPLLKCSALA